MPTVPSERTAAPAVDENLLLRLDQALALTEEPRIITSSEPPFKIVHTNRAWTELTGYSFAEIVGQTCSFLHGPATDAEALSELRETVRLHKTSVIKIVNYTKAGQPFLNTLSLSPIARNGRPFVHYLGIVRASFDAPEVRGLENRASHAQRLRDSLRAEEEEEQIPQESTQRSLAGSNGDAEDMHMAPQKTGGMKRSKRSRDLVRLEEALTNTEDAVVITEKEPPYKIVHTNQAWCDMCGYTAEEVEGKTNAILTGPETDVEGLNQLMRSVRRCEPTVQTLVNYKKGGVRFVNQVRVSPVYDERDSLVAYMALLTEVA